VTVVVVVPVHCRSAADAAVSAGSSESESETERTRDLQERDEFASRLRHKDEERTRRVMSKSEQKVIRYHTRCCYNVQSKADMSQLNLHTGPTTKKCKTEKVKTDMLRSNTKQSGEST